MASTSIPIHELSVPRGPTIRVEPIEPTPRPVRNEVHRHNVHELFIFERGTGSHMIDLATHDLVPPCIHAVAAGQVHKLDRSADCSGMVVMFDPASVIDQVAMNDLTTLFGPGSVKSVFPTSPLQLREAVGSMRTIAAELSAQDPVAGVPAAYLGILIAKCASWKRMREKDALPTLEHMDLVHRFLAAVDAGFRDQRSVQGYARQLAISAGHLNDMVKQRMGRSASEVIHDRLILEAKRLLLHAELSVKEVGFELKVSDPTYFNRLFKKATGMTPVQYREHVRDMYQ